MLKKLKDLNLNIRSNLVSEPRRSLGRESYLPTEVQLAYSTASTNWVVPLSQSGPESNGNGWVLSIPQSSRTGASPSNAF